MRLFEHEDFPEILNNARDHFDCHVQFIEKDYYVTETLRTVQTEFGNDYIFRGGTSLSKGWRLIDRFSEDIDLVLDRDHVAPTMSLASALKYTKKATGAVSGYDGLSLIAEKSTSSKKRGREDTYAYKPTFDEIPGIRPEIRLEISTAAGTEPCEVRQLSSLAAEYATIAGIADIATDTESFEMRLLHFRRTFVEKLFALHSYIVRWRESGDFAERNVRHYADLHALALTPEVVKMVKSDEYSHLKSDYDTRSSNPVRRDYRRPEALSFASSEAFYPHEDMRSFLNPIYDAQCRMLFNGPYPSFDSVLGCFEELRGYL